jgi:hypothetical protein
MSPAASHLVLKQCVSFSAAVILVAAAHLFTLQARSSSRRVASTPSPLSPFHASACRPSLCQAAARQFSSLGSSRPYLGRPSRLAVSTLAQRTPLAPYPPAGSNCALLSPAPSTSHRSLLLCYPCRADPTQLSNTFHVTACTRVLPTRTAGRQRDPEPSHQRACNSFRTDAPPFCVEVSSSPTFTL